MKILRLGAVFSLCFLSAFALALSARAESVTYTVLFPELREEVALGVSAGEAVTDGAGKEKAGEVLSVRTEAVLCDRYDEEAGAFVAEELPGLRRLLLTVRADAAERGGILTAGTLRLRVGETVALHLPSLSAEGRIVKVEVLP